MKKFLLLFPFLMMAVISVSLTACGDDDSLSGLYYYESTPMGDRAAFNFINRNTVEVYYGVTRNSNETYHGEKVQSFPLRSGWYYWSGNKRTYSYTIIDDVVVIGDDIVMVKSGNTLIYDELGVILQKWDENESSNDDNITPTPGEYIDLGLPSGTLWATKNVGANKPEDYGDYFAWGETQPKSHYGWGNYKWMYNWPSTGDLTKYCTSSYWGSVDNKTELEPADDAAYVNWGSKWRIPTKLQLDELQNECTWQWRSMNGVYGYLVISKRNSNSIFLPSGGCFWGDSSEAVGSGGYYWSRTLSSSTDDLDAYALHFGFHHLELNEDQRCGGSIVRAVRR